MRRARISSGGVRSSSLFLATGRDGCVATGDVYYGVAPDAMQRRCTSTPHACHHSIEAAASASCASVSTPATFCVCDNCRPLFAIAEILLADVKQKFTVDRIFSKRTCSNCVHNERATLAGSVSL